VEGDLDHLSDLMGADQIRRLAGDEADVLVSCASASMRVSAYEEALAIVRAALTIDPEHPRAWALAGISLEKLGRPLEAKSAYATALLHDDHDPFTAVALARLHIAGGHIAKARALLDWVVIHFNESKHARQQAMSLLGRIEQKSA
jgi:Flp pilus assembly protein TadD